MKVAVVGAGIIGLSSAVCIQCSLPNAQVTIISEFVEQDTTSDGAAGLFHPNYGGVLGGADQSDMQRWIAASADHYWRLCYSEEAVDFGVFEISGYSVSNSERKGIIDQPANTNDHQWMKNHCHLEGANLDKIGGGTWRYGDFYTTLVTEPRSMMAQLNKTFIANKGTYLRQRLHSLSGLVGQFDLVINCSGSGARELVGDKGVYPIRGQVSRVSAPWIKHFYFAEHEAYIIPNRDVVVLGATLQKDNWSLDFSQEDRDRYMELNCQIFPSLKRATPVRDWVGLRPGRASVRLELEEMQFSGDKTLNVIHNYGHGGNGIALSWGCGLHVARIAHELADA